MTPESHTCHLCGRSGVRQFLRDRVEGRVVWKCESKWACLDRQAARRMRR